ncbi:MAG: SLC13 family permease [Planctomycetota bacterium]
MSPPAGAPGSAIPARLTSRMGYEAWLTLAVVVAAAVALVRGLAGPDVILLGALAMLVGGGVVDPAAAVSGFGNQGLATVAALFIVVAGLTHSGAAVMMVDPLLGRPKGLRRAIGRMMAPVAALSAVLNNTAVVAMALPAVRQWAVRLNRAPSKLLLPLSYAAILGGTCTLIGTSTNLVVNGILIEHAAATGRGDMSLGLFELAKVGLPCALAGIVYCVWLGPKLLPDRSSALVAVGDDVKKYTVEMQVDAEGPLVGRTIEQAGLRSLPGLYLAELGRGEEVIPAVEPTQRLSGGDRLVFVGVVDSVVDLRKIRGLSPATDQVDKVQASADRRGLVEAVVSDHCPLIGRSIREGRFRSRYGAAVIAVARGGQRLAGKIGDIVLQPGDTLLLEATPTFHRQHRHSRDFFLVSLAEEAASPRHDRAYLAIAVMAGMMAAVVLGFTSMLGAATVAAAAMVLLRCCRASQARSALDWPVLLTIGAALGVGQAVADSGLATALASGIIDLVGDDPRWVLAGVYLVTMLLTSVITNNAAAVLITPIALAAAATVGVSPLPFAVAVMLAASNDFATPIGYQTNLMVYGPGGYRFTDYLKFGAPLNALVFVISVLLIPWAFPFS